MCRLVLRLIRGLRYGFDLRLDGLRSAGLASLTGSICIDWSLVDLKCGGGRAVNLSRRGLCRLDPWLRRGIVRSGRRSRDLLSWPSISLHGCRDLRCRTRLDRGRRWPIRARSCSRTVRIGRLPPDLRSWLIISLHRRRDLRCRTRLDRSRWWPIRLRSGACLRRLRRNCHLRRSLLLIWSATVGVNSGILQFRVNGRICGRWRIGLLRGGWPVRARGLIRVGRCTCVAIGGWHVSRLVRWCARRHRVASRTRDRCCWPIRRWWRVFLRRGGWSVRARGLTRVGRCICAAIGGWHVSWLVCWHIHRLRRSCSNWLDHGAVSARCRRYTRRGLFDDWLC